MNENIYANLYSFALKNQLLIYPGTHMEAHMGSYLKTEFDMKDSTLDNLYGSLFKN